MRLFLQAFGLTLVAAFVTSAVAEARECEPAAGRLVSVEGLVEVESGAGWQSAEVDTGLCEEDTVRTGRNSRAAISLLNDAVLRLDQNTTVRLVDITPEPEERSFLDMIAGAIQSFSRDPRRLEVDTPYLNATVEGTEFALLVTDGRSELTVLEGQVRASNDEGAVSATSGQIAEAPAGMPPTIRLIARPRDAVQWALYYPSILAVDPAATPQETEAARLAKAGRPDQALDTLNNVPAGSRDAGYHVQRAGLLLNVGRVEEAVSALDQASSMNPNLGSAQALAAIIDVVQNRRDRALENAQRAVELDPDGVAPKLALSYAQQARFNLAAARDAMLQASEQNPDSALAWARLSELWLALGYRDRSREAGDRAVELDPNAARAYMVRGFAALTEFDTPAAKADFEKSVSLDPANPMPHLGLGLAKIKEGMLEDGRGDIDVAVAMDSNSSLLRSYLGKAYFEEKRNTLSAQQLEIAKDLDPNDPTPHLYDAIRLQTENRPGEALAEIQKSIDKNDNRAVYRGQLQLDEDRAARQSSLARVYEDLGFTQPAQREATKSLTLDHSNASAHRFLSESYRSTRRRESARVSEEFQAQMLQDININPVSPSFSETNLNIVTQGGPATAGLNEFNALFNENEGQISASGTVGNNDTLGGETVLSMTQDWFSASAGIFAFETDGWRQNNDITHTIANLYAQAALTPELNTQLELRKRKTKEGDLAFNFDPDLFDPDFEQEIETEIARAGVRYSPAPHSEFLLSGFYVDREEDESDRTDVVIPGFGTVGQLFDNNNVSEIGHQSDAQYIYKRDRFNVLIGGAIADFDRDLSQQQSINFLPFPPFAPLPPGSPRIQGPPSGFHEDVDHTKGYVYTNINIPEPVTWTVGFSYDDYSQDLERAIFLNAPIRGTTADVETFNPKLGVQWNVTDELLLRAAYFEIVKPLLASNRTLEPTQVAGFNQLYDDSNGVESKRWGVGFDWNPMPSIFLGAEATFREKDERFFLLDPVSGAWSTGTIDQNEETHRAYFHWLPDPQWAYSAEVVYDSFESDRSLLTRFGPFPEDLETISFPLGVNYFHPSGFFAGATGTYVRQDVARSSNNALGLPSGNDEFFLADLAVGYRLPNRIGMASLVVRNVFDEEFKFQDDSFREFGDNPSIGPYIPDRQIEFRLTLQW